ncbi:hypothetical protein A1Q1_00641 [Trichosporon asahii var. asahii CBS 2479]|uniref:Uncharacterized protein n=1 Tax=Trichosporon asahii var. asahii (strain ATCC 90039 / CBS 2479 / JCM 2466 / KCTC 7840 / NBRC 103889/ NCYC 2677 / UAMH 7654) TaxID=1186058 RepID=J6EZT1_TRIAS|nr:hypothetical protein A1Q1_00641 [Trichosporon asahii var. asahii CBS 2479]EJT50174.1 hypothetical protein A1Q1_00641 [Trichosporon asahii var. asahii CBS 2479]
MSPTSLDPNLFPHLFDGIIAHLHNDGDERSLATLRASSSLVRDLVDRQLAVHMAVVDGRMETHLLALWKDEWKDGNPMTRVVDFYDKRINDSPEAGSPVRFLKGSHPAILREVGYAFATHFRKHPCNKFTFISMFDFSKGRPITDDDTFDLAAKCLSFEAHADHSIASAVYHHGYGLQHEVSVEVDPGHTDDSRPLSTTVMFAPNSSFRKSEYPPAVPIVYAPRHRTGQLNELIDCIVELLWQKGAPTVQIVGAEFWEETWWDFNMFQPPLDGLPEALSKDTERERVLAVWKLVFDDKVARLRQFSIKERLVDAESRVTFISLPVFREQIGEYMFGLCTECDFEDDSDEGEQSGIRSEGEF